MEHVAARAPVVFRPGNLDKVPDTVRPGRGPDPTGRFPVDLATVLLRARQTYGDWIPSAPNFIADWVVTLPIGLMFVRAINPD